MAKIAITIPQETLEKARGAIRHTRSSLSAYIARAIDMRVQDEDLQRTLDQMLAETGGPLTAKERREADAVLGIRSKRKKK